MTSPTYANTLPGRGRYYFHPNGQEQWPSVTNVLDTSISKPALVPWAAKITAEKAWKTLPQMVKASRTAKAREALTKEIKGEVRIAKDMAADLGSRVHALAEAYVLGKPMADDPEAQPFVDQVLRFYSEYGINPALDIEAAEATVLNRRVGYAGTGDLWVWLNLDGERRLWLLDYKTSLTRAVNSVYPEYGMQLAAIAKADLVLLDDGTEVPAPGPIYGTAILNLRTKDYGLWRMPYDGDVNAAFNAFKGALTNTKYLHSLYGAKPVPVSAPIREKGAA